MSLFNQILGAMDNPNLQANPNQISSILNTVQQMSNTAGTNPTMVESALSIVGNHVRSSLANAGPQQAQTIVNQYGGTTPNPQAVNALFAPNQIMAIVQAITQGTGLNANLVQQMLPLLVPLVLNLLKTGNPNQNTGQASNPVLNAFLDTNGDGTIDAGDFMQLAGRFMQR